MSNCLQDAMAWLAERQAASMPVSITYGRSTATLELTAVVGRTVRTATDAYGDILERMEFRDYLIDADALDFDSGGLFPVPGDWVQEGDDVYEVLDLPAEPCWTWSDSFRTRMRVHTKRRGAA